MSAGEQRPPPDAFRLLAEAAPVGMVAGDEHGTVTWANRRWRQITGYEGPLPLPYEGLRDLVHPDDREGIDRVFAAAGAAPEVETQARLVRPDGSVLHCRLQAAVVVDDDGRPGGYVGLLTDLSELVEATEARLATERRYRALVDQAPVGQVVSHADGRLIEVNRAFVELMGSTREELLSRPPAELFHPDDLPGMARLVGRLLRGEIDHFETERRLRRADGTIVWVAGGTTALREGDTVLLHSILHDITERKLAEEALRDSEARYRDVVEALHDAVLVQSRSRLETVNRAALELLGHSLDELADPATWEAMDPRDPAGRPVPLAERATIVAMRERRPISEQVVRLRIPGRGERWFNVNARPRLRDGEVIGSVTTMSDVTERTLAENALRKSEARFRTLAESLPVGVYLADLTGVLEYVNPAWSTITGIPESEAVGRQALRMVHPDDVEQLVRVFTRSVADRRPYRAEYRIVTPSGEIRWVSANGAPVVDETGRMAAFIGSIEDITPLVTAEHETARLAGIVEATSDLVGIGELETGKLVYLNRAARERFGYVDRDITRTDFADLYHPDTWGVLDQLVLPALRRGEAWSGELAMIAADGSTIQVWQTISATADSDGRITEVASVGRDVTERRRLEEALAHQATHDGLTDLPNRALLLDHAGLALARARRDGHLVSLLFLDLDRFKQVNHTHGHDAGDELLRQVARRIAGMLRPADTVARLGGDEFVVLCEDVDDEHHAVAIAQRILSAIEATPFRIAGAELHVTASIGIALASGAADAHPEALLRDADAAMYRAKDLGRARLEVFDESMRRRTAHRLALAEDLTHGIEQGRIAVHYQPAVDLRTGRVTSVEALARWDHPERGLLGPSEFIPLAEETGLIVRLGLQVLTVACTEARRWVERLGPAAPRLHVNLSSRQLAVPDLRRLVEEALEASGLRPDRLCLEITESVVMDDAEGVIDRLRELKEIGVSLAIDDFGTGYSSLSYLRRFPVDILKVDQSFVDGLGPDPEDSAIVAAIVSLASTLELEAVAEGVETAEQLAELRRLGCTGAQGYLFAKPVPAEEIEGLLDRAFDL
jgi:diguanylate cyclase (GGDEF)-like protein/PAS domain S-box-containing protein